MLKMFYIVLNSFFINWATFMLKLAVRIIAKISRLTSDKRVNAIVVDDTFTAVRVGGNRITSECT